MQIADFKQYAEKTQVCGGTRKTKTGYYSSRRLFTRRPAGIALAGAHTAGDYADWYYAAMRSAIFCSTCVCEYGFSMNLTPGNEAAGMLRPPL